MGLATWDVQCFTLLFPWIHCQLLIPTATMPPPGGGLISKNLPNKEQERNHYNCPRQCDYQTGADKCKRKCGCEKRLHHVLRDEPPYNGE